METALVVVHQPGRQPLFVQVHGRLELGRDCDGLLLADAQVSRRHAELRISGDRLLVVDLGSTNGTAVDGAPADEPIELRPGGEARLGETTVRLVVAEPERPDVSVKATTIALGRSSGGVMFDGPGSGASAGPAGDDLRRTSIELVAEGALSDHWQPAIDPTDGGTLTIVFSDIESSTELATRMGDRDWFALLESHNQIVREQLRRHGGTEVKSQGDGFMLSFPSARRAVLFAVAAQRALEARRAAGGHAVRVRMGMHTGEAIVDRSGDLFGRHVIVAARVANLADGGEVLVSSLVREIVAARGDIRFGPPREVELKGIDGQAIVYPIDWAHGSDAGADH